jgi:hypothetical protein
LVPALGPSWRSMSTNELNSAGCITARFSAQVPPEEKPATPQLAGAELAPNLETT